MKIVVLDGYTENPGDLSWSGFEALGELTVYDRTGVGQIVERIGDAEIVYTNKTPITRKRWRSAETSALSAYWPPVTTWSTRGGARARHSGCQHPQLRDGRGGSVRHCHATGDLPSRRTTLRCRARGPVGELPGLLLLGLSLIEWPERRWASSVLAGSVRSPAASQRPWV